MGPEALIRILAASTFTLLLLVAYLATYLRTELAARTKAADELSRANRFLDAIVEYIPAMVFVKEASELRFVRFNRAGEDLLGVKMEQLQGKNDFDFFPREQAEFFVAKDRETLAAGAVVDIPEEPIETPRGSRWLHTRKVPIKDESGRPAFLLGIAQDITGQRETREALRTAKETAEAASRELEAFSYSVSHDLRAPLRSIAGFSDALLEDCAPALDENGRAHLDRIRAATRRMSTLIDDLLKLSRINRAELRPESIDVSALAEGVLAELREADPGRKVTTRVAPGMTAQGDSELFRIALVNLLGNAWKFTAKNSGAEIVVGEERDGAERVFFVRDNGAGFDMRYSTKLFGAFQRLHSAAEFEGTGIGLATVQRIVLRHGGRVWADSRPQEGTTFRFTVAPGAAR